MKLFYFLLMIVGAVLPMSQFIDWLDINGLNIPLFINEILTSQLSLFAWLDVIISALVLIGFILYEGNKSKMKNLWIPILGTLCIGVSFGLPLFLFLREGELRKRDLSY